MELELEVPKAPKVSGRFADLWWESDELDELKSSGIDKHWRSHRIALVPQHKFAFVIMEKCAGTQFNLLVQAMSGIEGPSKWPFVRPANDPEHLKLDLGTLTQESGWRWATFVREPMARYLSAWGSKCMVKEDDGSNCLGGEAAKQSYVKSSLEQKTKAFTAHLRAALDDKQRRNASWRENPHWETQTKFLSTVPKSMQHLDFVGRLSGDVNGQVKEMLRLVGAPENLADTYFPKIHVAGHHTSLGRDIEAFYADGNEDVFSQLWYAEDYDLLHDR
jgi:hypothetical protein